MAANCLDCLVQDLLTNWTEGRVFFVSVNSKCSENIGCQTAVTESLSTAIFSVRTVLIVDMCVL